MNKPASDENLPIIQRIERDGVKDGKLRTAELPVRMWLALLLLVLFLVVLAGAGWQANMNALNRLTVRMDEADASDGRREKLLYQIVVEGQQRTRTVQDLRVEVAKLQADNAALMVQVKALLDKQKKE